MRVYGVLGVQVHQGADRADQLLSGVPVGNEVASEHGVEQLRQLAAEDPVQRRMRGRVPAGREQPTHEAGDVPRRPRMEG